MHKKHASALEKALRCLDNEAITSEEIDPLKDELDYYIVSAWAAAEGAVLQGREWPLAGGSGLCRLTCSKGAIRLLCCECRVLSCRAGHCSSCASRLDHCARVLTARAAAKQAVRQEGINVSLQGRQPALEMAVQAKRGPWLCFGSREVTSITLPTRLFIAPWLEQLVSHTPPCICTSPIPGAEGLGSVLCVLAHPFSLPTCIHTQIVYTCCRRTQLCAPLPLSPCLPDPVHMPC